MSVLKYALSGVARSGATPSAYLPATFAQLYVGGSNRTRQFDKFAWGVDDELNDQPNKASFEVFGFTPTLYSLVVLYTAAGKEFEGRIQQRKIVYDRKNNRAIWKCTAQDYSWDLEGTTVTGRYSGSATEIGWKLAALASGFTRLHIQNDLPSIDEIQFTFTPLPSAFRQLADRFGGDFYVDYDKDIHLFLTETSTTPKTLQTSNKDWRGFSYEEASAGIENRIYCQGEGTTVPTGVDAGDTIVPIEIADIFSASGGLALVDNQLISYTALQASNDGSLVGPGASPSSAPSAVRAAGSGLGQGTYQGAVSFVTAAGESIPSPVFSVTTGTISAPSNAPTMTGVHPTWSTNSYVIGDTYDWAYVYDASAVGDRSAATDLGPTTSWVATTGPAGAPWASIPNIRVQYSSDASVTYLHLFERHNGGAWYLAAVWPNVVGSGTTDTNYSTWGSTGASNPTPNANLARLTVTGLAVGPSGTTSRKYWRTVVGGSQLKLAQTIGDNTTTGLTDSTADSALGANAPTSDTSGLTQPTGVVNQGSTTLLLAGAGAFSTTGGWVRVGADVVIRYTGISGNTLTGIPASGNGALSAAVAYNTTVTAVPALTGVPATGTGALTVAITTGVAINLIAQADSTSSQSTYGVRVGYIVDQRLSLSGATARAQAELLIRASERKQGGYTTDDLSVRSGRRVTLSMASEWGLTVGTFTIQRSQSKLRVDRVLPERDVDFGNLSEADLPRIVRAIERSAQGN